MKTNKSIAVAASVVAVLVLTGLALTACDDGSKPIINQTPLAADYNIGNLTQTAGNVKAVTITPKSGKSTGTVTIYYNGSTTLPTAVGTYTVTFDVAAAMGFNAVSGLSAGTLTIVNQTPVASDYNIGNLNQTVGSVTAVTITAKSGKSTGSVIVYYNGLTTLPTAAGSYAVTFSVAAATGWSAASGLSAGTLMINIKITAFTVDAIPAQTYNGSAITPAVTVKDGTITLTLDAHYTLSYSNNTNAGTATVTVTGAGTYAGSSGNRTFTINKAAGALVDTPTLNTKTSNSITINPVNQPGTGQSVEYAKNTSNSAPSAGWQAGTTFSGLNRGTIYYIFARSAGNNNYETGAASSSLPVEVPDSISFNLTFRGPTEKVISITKTVTDNFSKSNGGTITLGISENFTNYEWFVGGSKVATGKNVTLQASNSAFVTGNNWITVVVYDNATPWSGEFMALVTY
jgi:hypothetical protein